MKDVNRFEKDPYKQKEFFKSITNIPKPEPDVWEKRAL